MLNDAKLLGEKLKKAASQLSYFPQTLGLVWTATRVWTLSWLVLLIIQGVLPAALVYLSRILVDSLVIAMDAGVEWVAIKPVLWLVIAVFGIMLLLELLQSINDWIRAVQAELIQDQLYTFIHEKSITIDMAFYESAEYYDQLSRAREDASERSLTLIESAGSLLQSTITLLAMATLLLPYGYWIPTGLVISTLPAFFVVTQHSLRYHKWWKQATADRRRAAYYDAVLTFDQYAAELRLFDLGPYFRENFKNLRTELRKGRLKLVFTESIARLAAGVLAILITGLCMIWMGWRAIQGASTLGDLALFYQAFSRGQALLRSLLGHLGDIYTNSLFLGNLFEFLGLESRITPPDEPRSTPATIEQGIHFQHITFCYPGSKQAALTDFDLVIPARQIIAIVGANGAGKSTLVKLLCRLYDPDKGSIRFDDVDIRNFSLQELREMITVMFQKPVQYYATASENIAISRYRASPDPKSIENVAKSAGAHNMITRLPQGYDTPLGKWFTDGTELSSGEWQRIALARAFLRKAPVVILDEPTSFMDSWAEAEWLKRFRELVQGLTGIIITHRFTTAMQADIIHVMDQGRIVESGSHSELIAQHGRYAKSWHAQIRVR